MIDVFESGNALKPNYFNNARAVAECPDKTSFSAFAECLKIQKTATELYCGHLAGQLGYLVDVCTVDIMEGIMTDKVVRTVDVEMLLYHLGSRRTYSFNIFYVKTVQTIHFFIRASAMRRSPGVVILILS